MRGINLVGLAIAIFLASCQKKEESRMAVQQFELSQVKLLDGPFLHATQLNIETLLNYEPDRLLAKFRSEAGLEPKAEHYHGWEDNTIAGHSLGHYLSACAMMYQTTGDERFLERVKYIVDELETVQNANGDGYIGAFPDGKRILMEEVAKGDIRSQGFDLNGIWVPFYTQHKVMGGLRDAYHLCGVTKALEVERKFADWLEKVVTPLNNDQVQKMLHCEYGGINEVLVELYNDTGDKRYLDMSYIFHHKAVLDSLAAGQDVLPGIHANTQIPKLVGLARRYEVTGDQKDYKTATFFWDRVVNHHSYVTGGNSNHEYFGEPDKLTNRLSDGTTETCNVYNMLKLSSHIFQWEPDAKVADYYERALFNHILSAQHPETGRVIYNLSLDMGGKKSYQDPMWFTCCVGSGMETHSKYGRNIFYYNDSEFYVSQFIAAEVNWKEKGLKISQVTKYPEEQNTTLEFSVKEPTKLNVKIRYPYWAENGVEIKVNDTLVSVQQHKGEFISIEREWEDGDKVDVSFPFSLRLETMPDDEQRVAVMYGPMVLAADLGPNDDPAANKPDYVPVILTENRSPSEWLEKVETNVFKTAGVGSPRDVVLKPFYATHDRRYSVYLDMFNNAQWEQHKLDYQDELEKKKKLEDMTYDLFSPGEMQSERDHNFQGDSVYVEEFKGKKARAANRGGWLSFEMKVMTGQPMALVAEYWGGFTGSKTFDILVNDQKIATENISGIKDGEFIDVKYEIPDELTATNNRITVRLQPHVGHRAGPVFKLRTIKR